MTGGSHKKVSVAELFLFVLLSAWIICWTNSRVAHGWRCYDANVISLYWLLVIFTRGQLWPSGIVVACVCLCVCVYVCVCVRQSSVCPDDNLSPAQATITKFGPEVQNTLIKIPIVFGVHWPWPSRLNWTLKSKFTPFWACEFVRTINQYQMKWGFPNLDQKCILVLLRSLLILGLIDLDLHFHF